MEETSEKLRTLGDGGAEYPHISEGLLPSEHDGSSKSEIKFPPMDPKNFGGSSLAGHPNSGVTNATTEKVTNKDGTSVSPILEQGKSKRNMLNRLSAQKSRLKKAKYMVDLENNVKDLELMVSELSPIVELEKQKQLRLKEENSFLLQKLDTYAEISTLKNAQLERTRAEIEKLKEVQMKIICQREKLVTGWGVDSNSGLDEITTGGFYLESGPPSLDREGQGGLDLMLSLSTSATIPEPDGSDQMQNSDAITTICAVNSPPK